MHFIMPSASVSKASYAICDEPLLTSGFLALQAASRHALSINVSVCSITLDELTSWTDILAHKH